MNLDRFVVQRKDLHDARWERLPSPALPEGAVRLRVESFALTANNVTYGAFGDAMNYFGFFPTGSAETGCIPVWGFATVVESRCEGVAVGERLYGYLPMANEVTLQPARVNEGGFMDGAAHRRELHPVYNQYLRCAADAGYDAAREAEQALLRPLFTTSFLIDDFLADNDFFGARQVLLSSASSKTAYGTAFCIGQRRGTPQAVKVVGLTSPSNTGFTQALGCYDEVLPYGALTMADLARPSVYVDFSGSASLRAQVHELFGEGLLYSCSVGGTDWQAMGSGKGLPGPRPVLFFAPAQIKKRNADWGPPQLQFRLAQAWQAFLQRVTDPQRPWLRVVQGQGPQAVAELYAAFVDGQVDPLQGHMLSP
jgi:hypothetical protein